MTGGLRIIFVDLGDSTCPETGVITADCACVSSIGLSTEASTGVMVGDSDTGRSVSTGVSIVVDGSTVISGS